MPIIGATMTYDDLIRHFGTQTRAAEALGLAQPSVSEWQQRGIPFLRQLHIEKLTKGRLKAEFKSARVA